MNKCACLKQFQRGSCCHRSIAVVSACATPAPVTERRAKSLTAAKKFNDGIRQRAEVVTDVLKYWHLVRKEFVKPLLHANPKLISVQWRDARLK